MRLLSMRQRLLILGLLGVVMTLSVAGAALVCLRDVGAINRELAVVTRALHFHQDADMMHDALRADVARAELAGSGEPGYFEADVRRDADRHAARFRRDLDQLEELNLSPQLEATLTDLRPEQETYIVTAEALVDSALTHPRRALAEQASYEVSFQALVPTLEHATETLLAKSADVKRAAEVERAEAERMISLATLAALAGWVALVAWHHRSMRSLQRALVREAEQRSAADLLQRSLLPTHLPDLPGIALAARSDAAGSEQKVGGDWYDVLTLPSGEVCLVVGDVVGHDLPAAAIMGQVRNALRAYALEDPSPTTVLGRLNRAACLLDASDLTTCICVLLDPATMVVRWSSAGHPPPLVLPATGAGHLLAGEPGPPLGVQQAASYQEHQLTLTPGETLLLYTDGLVERRGRSIDVGLAALENVALRNREPAAMCDQLFANLVEDSTERDDVTCLLLQVEPQPVTSTGAHSTSESPALPARASRSDGTTVSTGC
jgi:serine phosphatase RsbU (regulator of sigma subunit)